jgi:hypothetical protein
MAIVGVIPLTPEQAKELEQVEFANELHLVKEPNGTWTVDNGDMIVFEFAPEGRICPDCGAAELDASEGYRWCYNCGWDTIEQARRDREE